MSLIHLRVIEGRATEDSLVTTILHAIKVAEACRSDTTVELLKMALLNEGIRLAAYLSNDPVDARGSGSQAAKRGAAE
ncbi:MAG: hypothetical protein JWR89_2474 [Tardiphaga sp.]|jgi:hypothetical protein|uniref:hypothetical protein n=1 Tax=Tardiphaga sp. TaxID=1926292 RepID=UPI0026065B85|nr:hypothetical protein [Tardiphaga sp.]MDB5502572.1 hypothetical protein [Tardiphaga sp.]